MEFQWLTGTGSPDFKLIYDIYLSDYLGDGNEQLDVADRSML